MTDPTPPLHAKGDMILLDGVITRVLSWPAENNGPFFWEQYSKHTKSWTTGTTHTFGVDIEDYDGPEPDGSAFGPAPVVVDVDAETPIGDAVEAELAENDVAVEEPAAAAVAEEAPAAEAAEVGDADAAAVTS